jgi:hypothetical protein
LFPDVGREFQFKIPKSSVRLTDYAVRKKKKKKKKKKRHINLNKLGLHALEIGIDKNR